MLKGKKLSNGHRKKLSEAHMGKLSGNKGNKYSLEVRKHLSDVKLKNPVRYWLGKKRPDVSGENHYKWIKDRKELIKKQERNDVAYKEWRKQVWLRDNFKCKIANPDCVGRIEAHHILSWSDYPELRYQINNGITLCHAHHPMKKTEEKRLSPYFQELLRFNLLHSFA